MPNTMLEKASDKGARLGTIVKFKDYYSNRIEYTVNLFTTAFPIKLKIPFPSNGNMLMVEEKNVEFMRV